MSLKLYYFLILVMVSVCHAKPHLTLENCMKTTADLLGPAYHTPYEFNPTNVFCSGVEGFNESSQYFVTGYVLSEGCRDVIPGAEINIWQVDPKGVYSLTNGCYGKIYSDENGHFEFLTIPPGRYRVSNGLRPAHIHYLVNAEGYSTLVTQMYFCGDPYIFNDSCEACQSGDESLTVQPQTSTDDPNTEIIYFYLVLSPGEGIDAIVGYISDYDLKVSSTEDISDKDVLDTNTSYYWSDDGFLLTRP